MQLHIGTKAVLARAMTRQAYNDYRGWTLPADENGEDEGFLVEYIDGGASNHPDHAGYVSWSPADVFARAYKPSGAWGMGEALVALRNGRAVQRAGWNGKGMFIYLVGPGRYAATTAPGMMIATEQADGLVPYGPYVAMKTAQGDVVPWLASQTDLLAQDWGLYAEGSAAN
jgi:hypothetical protein